ncbi:MAG: hypothetical protein IPJ56_20380 [Gemmatimonadetes bacterium]|nr:hypothetical protein [Gemmatimonadota bacterium]
MTQAGFAIRENIAQAVQKQLKDVGVDVKIQLVDGTSISSLWFEGKFDAMLHWWHMPSDPEITLFFASTERRPPGATSTTSPTTRSTRCSTPPTGRWRRGRGGRCSWRRSSGSRSSRPRSRCTT